MAWESTIPVFHNKGKDPYINIRSIRGHQRVPETWSNRDVQSKLMKSITARFRRVSAVGW